MTDWRDLLWADAHRIAHPLPRLSIAEWADSFRVVPAGTSPEPGPWSTSRAPYLREPMESITADGPSHVVMMFASQVGKSEVLLNALGYYACQDPSPQLLLQPTLDIAEAFSRERLEPMIRATPALSEVIDQRERQRGTTKLRKDYPGGYIALVGTNSPAGLASRPIRVLLCDEVDRYVETREGDPVTLAMQRTANFSTRRILFASTPTVAGKSCIESWWLRGDQREFRVPCPSCGQRTRLRWPLVRWDSLPSGDPDLESVHIPCPSCGAKMRGPGKPPPDQLAAGIWVPTARSEEGIRSYQLSALYSPWIRLDALVTRFVKVSRSRDKAGLREFVNLVLGEPWDDQTASSVTWSDLRQRGDAYTPQSLPREAVLLTAGVDVQRDRLEATVWAWGAGKESWAVEHRVLYGAPDTAQPWRDLEAFLGSPRFREGDQTRMPVACTLVDSGDGMTTREVYDFTRRHEAERVFACKGRGGSGIALVMPSRTRNAYGAHLINVGVDSAKDALHARLALIEPGPGCVHFPVSPELGFSDEYFRQLTAEILVRRRRGNVLVESWQKIRDRNEALDCAVYALAALELLHPDLDALSNPDAPHITAAAMHRRRPPSRGVQL